MVQLIKMLLILLILTFSSSYSQDSDSLIQLYPGMEDTISFVDRTYFGLYNQVSGFQSATIYLSDSEDLISKITYEKNGILKDTTIISEKSVLESTRQKMDVLLKEYDKKLVEPADAVVRTYLGGKYSGKLEAFSKNYLYLRSNRNFFSGEEKEFYFKIPASNVDEVVIIGKAEYLSPVLWGAGIGFVCGFLFPLGFAASVDEVTQEEIEPEFDLGTSLGLGVLFALLGAAVGWGIGWLSADDDETIRFKTDQSVIRLKEYARYHFRTDKPFYEYYYEINE